MSRTITTSAFQVDRVRKLSDACQRDEVAGLVGPLVHLHGLAAVLEHLWHERQSLESTVLIQRAEDFLFAPYSDRLAGAQSRHSTPCSKILPCARQQPST